MNENKMNIITNDDTKFSIYDGANYYTIVFKNENLQYLSINGFLVNMINCQLLVYDNKFLKIIKNNEDIIMAYNIENKYMKINFEGDDLVEIFIENEFIDHLRNNIQSDDDLYPYISMSIKEVYINCIEGAVTYRLNKDDYIEKDLFRAHFSSMNEATKVTIKMYEICKDKLKDLLDYSLKDNYIYFKNKLYKVISDYIGTTIQCVSVLETDEIREIKIVKLLEEGYKYISSDNTIIYENEIANYNGYHKLNDNIIKFNSDNLLHKMYAITSEISRLYSLSADVDTIINDYKNNYFDIYDKIYDDNVLSDILEQGLVYIYHGSVYIFNSNMIQAVVNALQKN